MKRKLSIRLCLRDWVLIMLRVLRRWLRKDRNRLNGILYFKGKLECRNRRKRRGLIMVKRGIRLLRCRVIVRK